MRFKTLRQIFECLTPLFQYYQRHRPKLIRTTPSRIVVCHNTRIYIVGLKHFNNTVSKPLSFPRPVLCISPVLTSVRSHFSLSLFCRRRSWTHIRESPGANRHRHVTARILAAVIARSVILRSQYTSVCL